MERLFSKAWFKAGAVVLKGTFSGFSDDKGPKLSASLAYTTVFSLGPLLLMVMSLASLFFGHEAIQGTVFRQLNGLLGASAASQVQDIIANIRLSGKTRFALITSIVTLFIGASSLFVEIQDSLNVIWRVKAKPKRGWLQFLRNRLLSGVYHYFIGLFTCCFIDREWRRRCSRFHSFALSLQYRCGHDTDHQSRDHVFGAAVFVWCYFQAAARCQDQVARCNERRQFYYDPVHDRTLRDRPLYLHNEHRIYIRCCGIYRGAAGVDIL